MNHHLNTSNNINNDMISEKATIHHTAVIYDNVQIEDDVYIGAHCVIGAKPEYKDFYKYPNKGVVIRKGAVLTGLVSVDGGTIRSTEIGENCILMKQSHVGHDCILENDITLSPGVRIGGHCYIMQWVNFGMNATCHQRQVVGEFSMIGMNCTITKKSTIRPYNTYIGSPAKFLSLNKKMITNEDVIMAAHQRYDKVKESWK